MRLYALSCSDIGGISYLRNFSYNFPTLATGNRLNSTRPAANDKYGEWFTCGEGSLAGLGMYSHERGGNYAVIVSQERGVIRRACICTFV